MNLRFLHLLQFRNYKELNLILPPEGAVFEGSNGSGKTNILESIYLLCIGRSQRGAKRAEMIKFGAEESYIEGEFVDENSNSSASIGFSRDKKLVMKVDGTIVHQISEWFGRRPVVSFCSDDLGLVYGSPEVRRKFMDILGSQVATDYLKHLISYRHWLSCRNRLLSEKFDKLQCEIYEERMVESGWEIHFKRQEILFIVDRYLSLFYGEISSNRETAKIIYNPSIKCDNSSEKEWKNVFYTLLNERRKKDIEKGFSSVGPHRDDISFLLDQKPARQFGSQGQCRSIVLSLKLSSVLCIEQYRKERMIFLIDDAVSELDPQRTTRVYSLIENKGQVFIATPYLNSPAGKKLLRCTVTDGNVVQS